MQEAKRWEQWWRGWAEPPIWHPSEAGISNWRGGRWQKEVVVVVMGGPSWFSSGVGCTAAWTKLDRDGLVHQVQFWDGVQSKYLSSKQPSTSNRTHGFWPVCILFTFHSVNLSKAYNRWRQIFCIFTCYLGFQWPSFIFQRVSHYLRIPRNLN